MAGAGRSGWLRMTVHNLQRRAGTLDNVWEAHARTHRARVRLVLQLSCCGRGRWWRAGLLEAAQGCSAAGGGGDGGGGGEEGGRRGAAGGAACTARGSVWQEVHKKARLSRVTMPLCGNCPVARTEATVCGCPAAYPIRPGPWLCGCFSSPGTSIPRSIVPYLPLPLGFRLPSMHPAPSTSRWATPSPTANK